MGWNKPPRIVKAEKFTKVDADGNAVAPASVVEERTEVVEAEPEVKAAARYHSVALEEMDEDLADEFDDMYYE